MTDTPKRESKVDFEAEDSKEIKKRPSVLKLKKSRSSFFHKLSTSFRRSGGERGADVDTLRGTHGPDFEGYAIINRGNDMDFGCGCFGPKKDMRERLVLVKGPFLFVFLNESDKAPKYAVSLATLQPTLQKEGGKNNDVWLETGMGEVEYEITFEKLNIAKDFISAVKEQSAKGKADLVRKRLGHETLLDKRKSVRYAETVAMKKVEAQPDKPEGLTANDVMAIAGPMPV